MRSFVRFRTAKNIPPVEIHRELVAVYGGKVMAVQHVSNWCREFDSGLVYLKDDQRSGRPSTSADSVLDTNAVVQANRCVSVGQLELWFNLS